VNTEGNCIRERDCVAYGNLASTGTVPLTGQLRPHQRSVANIGTVPLAFTWLITPGLRHCPNTIGTAHGRLRPHQRSVANIGTVPLAGDYARPAELGRTAHGRPTEACHVPATVRNLARGIGG